MVAHLETNEAFVELLQADVRKAFDSDENLHWRFSPFFNQDSWKFPIWTKTEDQIQKRAVKYN